MRRLPLTLGLAATTALALTATAVAAPADPADPADGLMAEDPTMAAMHADPEAMLAMHDHIMAMRPDMPTHLDDAGVDPDQMRDWIAAGIDHDGMHQRLRAAGVDVDAMHAGCPMTDATPHGGAMSHDRHH